MRALQYGTSTGNYSITVPVSQTATYPQASICGGFESTYTYIDPGLFNSANLTGLAPATKYFYRVGAVVSPVLCALKGNNALMSKMWLSAGGIGHPQPCAQCGNAQGAHMGAMSVSQDYSESGQELGDMHQSRIECGTCDTCRTHQTPPSARSTPSCLPLSLAQLPPST